VGLPEGHLLASRKFLSGDLQHGRIEVGRRQLGTRRKLVAQSSRHDPGTRRDFQHAIRLQRRNPLCHVIRVINEDDRTETPIVMLWNTADKVRYLVHGLSLIRAETIGPNAAAANQTPLAYDRPVPPRQTPRMRAAPLIATDRSPPLPHPEFCARRRGTANL